MTRRLAITLLLAGVVSACGETDTKLKVTDLEPTKGDVEGGTYVRIKGNRFNADGPRSAKVYFGSRQGTVVRFVNDDVQAHTVTGDGASPTVDSGILEASGAFELTATEGFTYFCAIHPSMTGTIEIGG